MNRQKTTGWKPSFRSDSTSRTAPWSFRSAAGPMASARAANPSSLRRVLSGSSSVLEPGLKSRAAISSSSDWSRTVRPPDFVHVFCFRFVRSGAAAQGRCRGGRTGRDAPQQGQRRPVADAPPALLSVLGDVLAGEGEDVVEEGAVDRTETVGGLLVLAFREGAYRSAGNDGCRLDDAGRGGGRACGGSLHDRRGPGLPAGWRSPGPAGSATIGRHPRCRCEALR